MYGFGAALAQMGNGALLGIRQADTENRQRALQDRAFGLQQAQDDRAQGYYDQQTQDHARALAAQMQVLKVAGLDDTSRTFAPAAYSVPDVSLPEGHRDSPTPAGLAPPRGIEDASGGVANPAPPAAAPKGGKGSGSGNPNPQVALAERTGKANALPDPDGYLASANQAISQAEACHNRIAAEMTKSGLDPNSYEGLTFKANLEKRFGSQRDALLGQASQLKQAADTAKSLRYAEVASTHILRGDIQSATPYLHTIGRDDMAQLVSGGHWNEAGDKFMLAGSGKNWLSREALVAATNPESTLPQRLDAFKRMDETVQKEAENQARIRAAQISAGAAHYDPKMAAINELQQIDQKRAALEAKGLKLDAPTEYRAQNLLDAYGINDARAKTQNADTNAEKVGGAKDAAKLKRLYASFAKADDNGKLAIVKELNDMGDFGLGTLVADARGGNSAWGFGLTDPIPTFKIAPPQVPAAQGITQPAPQQAKTVPAASASVPPVNRLKEGIATTFGNGQTWTLKNGQPIQVK